MTTTARLAIGLLLLAHAACYSTDGVKNGGLQCGPEGSCPDGFQCVLDGQVGQAGHCYRTGGAADAGTGSKADVFTGSQPDVFIEPACMAPYGPFAACVRGLPSNSTCDPVCQSGCDCGKRCILNPLTYSSFLCEASAVPSGSTFLQPNAECDISADICAPGSVCLDDGAACPSFCYKTCRTNSDCGRDSRCTANTIMDSNDIALEKLYLCSPPIRVCNPTGGAECVGKPSSIKCAFLAGLTGAVNDSSTVCDCATLRNKELGASCSALPDDCLPGHACIDKKCRRLCIQKGSGSPCESGGGCTPIYGSPLYGYCK